MVSSVLQVQVEEFVARLERMAAEYAGDAEYAELRSALPADFPF